MADTAHNSIQSIISDEKPTVRKSIVIGLGGSGMKGILAAKKYIETNLPWEAHRYLRWVGVDTTDIETSIEGRGGRYRFPSNQFFQEERRMLYISAPTPAELSYEFLRDKYQNDPAFSWLPNPDVYDISTRAGQGANQTRTLGRLAFFYNEQKLRETLIKERDRLSELSDDPRYFELMDVKEGSEKVDETISIPLKSGKNRYYFRDYLPKGHTLIRLEADDKTRLTLAPHHSEPLRLENFPKDTHGHFFEVNGDRFDGQSFHFDTTHVLRGGQINIFLTGSIVGGTGNGMLLDMVALIKDIFADFWPAPRIYGIVVLPSAFKRVVNNRNARANAYAALKEIDYFMNGNTFEATYPSGRKVRHENRLFDDGMLYLLDVENMSGNSLQGRDQVQELTGQFIVTFVATRVGGAIEERMVNDSTRAAVFLPEGESAQRRANYNSFGISRVIYPVPQLKEMGYRITALKMVQRFIQPVDDRLLIETLGDLNRGLVRSLRLNARLIFERMYPDFQLDSEVEMRSYREKTKRALEKSDGMGVVRILENLLRDYNKEEVERIQASLLHRMQQRYRLELDKIRLTLREQIHSYLKDPNKGFHFADTVLEKLLARLEDYQKLYYARKTGLARHSQKSLEKLIEELDNTVRAGSAPDVEKVEAVIEMSEFNYYHLIIESMLIASENFVREFKSEIYRLKNDEVTQLLDKVRNLEKILQTEVDELKFELLEKKNPLFFYLINKDEIESFLDRYFYSRLSIEDLSNDVDFVNMESADDAYQMVVSHLIATTGLGVLEMTEEEVKELITENWGDVLDKEPDEVRQILAGRDDENNGDGYELSETSLLRIDIENLRRKLMQIIFDRFKGFNFENISLRDLMQERNIALNKLLEKLDHYSRPYIFVDANGLKSVEYYRTITSFELNTYEEGDDPEATENDLPARLNHYMRRNAHVPPVSLETFVVPNYAKPYEIISIGILLGYPAFRVQSLDEPARDYHHILSEKTHPLHLFNNPDFDARYFPDPFRTTNYINPAKLWEGLVLFKALEEKEGTFVYEKSLEERMREIEAREQYRRKILDYAESVDKYGGLDKVPSEIITEGINVLAMLAKDPRTDKLLFRREYSVILRDILDGTGTGDRARQMGLTREQYVEKHVQLPMFASLEELNFFIETEPRIRSFLEENIRSTIQRTRENIEAGADILLPQWKLNQVELPGFHDKYAFFDYYEKNGSLEWQNLLRQYLTEKVNRTVTSSRFRVESDPTLIDRTKVLQFIDSLEGKMPEIVLWEVKVTNRIIK